MDIEQSFTVPFSPDLVWKSFQDVEGIVTCLPGASLTEPPQGDQLNLAMTVKLGPIVAAFKGLGEISLDEGRHTGVVSGQGSDRKSGSRVKGTAQFALLPDGQGGTQVDVVVDYSITGSLAQFSRGGIVRELATRMTEAFAGNLKNRLEAANDSTVAPAATEPPTAAGIRHPACGEVIYTGPEQAAQRNTAAPAQEPLDLGSMFWTVLWKRLRSLFGFKEKRRCSACGK